MRLLACVQRLARSTTFDSGAPESLLLRYLRRTTALNFWALPPAEELVALSLAPRPAQVSNELLACFDWQDVELDAIRLFWAPRLLAEVQPLIVQERNRPSEWRTICTHISPTQSCDLGDLTLCVSSDSRPDWSSAVVYFYLAEVDALPIDSLPTSLTEDHDFLPDLYNMTSSAAVQGEIWEREWRPVLDKSAQWVALHRPDDPWPGQLQDVWDELEAYLPVFPMCVGRSTMFWNSVNELSVWADEMRAEIDSEYLCGLWNSVRIKADASSHLQDCGAGSRSSRGRDGQSSANYGRIPTRADSRRTLFVRRRTFWPAPEVFAADTGTIHPLVLAVLR